MLGAIRERESLGAFERAASSSEEEEEDEDMPAPRGGASPATAENVTPSASPIRNSAPLGPYSRNRPRALW